MPPLTPRPVKVGIVGCGNISGQYFGHAPNFPMLDVIACADLNPETARAQAEKYGIPQVLTVDELLAHPEIEIVVNLTIPQAHVPIALQALKNGKHTYAEKPLGLDREEAKPLLEAAKGKNLRVGCAPDTFLGAGIQTARKVIDDGAIGTPVAFTAFMMGRGHESWHPSPEFYYAPGGGPMFDMGPYYLTALLNLLGPLKRLTGAASDRHSRAHDHQPAPARQEDHRDDARPHRRHDGVRGGRGRDDHHELRHASCPVRRRVPHHDLRHGRHAEGPRPERLRRARPDQPGGGVGRTCRTRSRPAMAAWSASPTWPTPSARAARTGRASEQAYTVLDAMQGFLDSSRTGQAYTLSAPYERPAPMPDGLPFGTLDE